VSLGHPATRATRPSVVILRLDAVVRTAPTGLTLDEASRGHGIVKNKEDDCEKVVLKP
jgi:hypothetical protein